MPTNLPEKEPIWLKTLGIALVGFFVALFGGGFTAIMFLITIPLLIIRGWAVVKLWSWFGEPLFPALWHPTIYSAVGLVFVIALLWPYKLDPSGEEKPFKVHVQRMLTSALFPVFTVGVAWLWRWIML